MTTRQKQVFPRDTVAHMWAHQAQDCARDPSGNFYYNGRTIYSYGGHFAMAHILSADCGSALAGLVLINGDSRSNTTSKHQAVMRGALTRQQRENALHVNGMNETSARAIDTALREKKLPSVCFELLQYVRDHVSALAGKKHSSGPFARDLSLAKRYEKTAMAFYKRAGKKYPLPVVPEIDDVPADKVARDAFILTFARADLERQYKSNLTHAQAGIVAAQNALVEKPDPESTTYMQCIVAGKARDLAQNAMSSAKLADTLYSRIHGADKRSAAAKKARFTLAPLCDALQARFVSLEKQIERERIERQIKRYAHARGRVRGGSEQAHHKNALFESVYHASGIASAAVAVGIPEGSWLHDTAKKMARANSLDSLQRNVGDALQKKTAGDSYFDAMQRGRAFVAGDVKAQYTAALRKATHIQTVAAENGLSARTFAHFAGELMAAVPVMRDRLADIDANIQKANADRIRAWCAGESNTRPDVSAGTFARIMRGNVETTRGAMVPIAHACRLARLYAVVMRRGGESWPDGSGPMVGHYRVNAIGADGSLVIGCHEFSPAEAQRLHGVLMSCADCAAVAA